MSPHRWFLPETDVATGALCTLWVPSLHFGQAWRLLPEHVLRVVNHWQALLRRAHPALSRHVLTRPTRP